MRRGGRGKSRADGVFDRREFLRGAVMLTAGGAAYYAFGCSSGDGAVELTPVLLASEFVANEDNRFVVGLLDGDGNLLRNAQIRAKFFTLAEDGKSGTLRGTYNMEFVELNEPEAHQHDTSGPADITEESVAFYVLGTPFDVAGKWSVELSGTLDDGRTAETIHAPFTVLAQSQTPALQTVPPASQNDTAATNPDTESLCSRDPICPFHDKTIKDVLGKGRPLVVQFSTPAFCESRFCGPVLEVLMKGAEPYRDRIDFVHIEVWEDRQANQYRGAMVEWNLQSEPYTFFMDSSGKVVGKLEGIFSEEDLSSALDQLVKL